MKGFTIGLPINILVVVVIAVIILLGIMALQLGGWGPFAGAVSLEGVKNTACRKLVQGTNCVDSTNTITISNFDADDDGGNDGGDTWDWTAPVCRDPGADGVPGTADDPSNDNLASLCYCNYGRTSDVGCKALCNCPGVLK